MKMKDLYADNPQKKQGLIEVAATIGLTALCLIIAKILKQTDSSIQEKIIADKKIVNNGLIYPKQVWTYYIAGYGNLEEDGQWGDWEFWTDLEWYPHKHEPSEKNPSVYNTRFGYYSSHNKTIIQQHFKDLETAKIDGIFVKWSGLSRVPSVMGENLTSFNNKTLGLLFEEAKSHPSIKIAPFIPVYPNRTGTTVAEDIRNYLELYSNDSSALMLDNMPVIAVYDAQNLEFGNLLLEFSEKIFLIGTGLSLEDYNSAYQAGFEGILTFFISPEQAWPSKTENWPALVDFSQKRDMLFVPSLGPGRNLTAHDPWSFQGKISRNNGSYYDEMWKSALNSSLNANIIFVNSFNDWLEGSGIEPPADTEQNPLNSEIWAGKDPEYFLKKTAEWGDIFRNETKSI